MDPTYANSCQRMRDLMMREQQQRNDQCNRQDLVPDLAFPFRNWNACPPPSFGYHQPDPYVQPSSSLNTFNQQNQPYPHAPASPFGNLVGSLYGGPCSTSSFGTGYNQLNQPDPYVPAPSSGNLYGSTSFGNGYNQYDPYGPGTASSLIDVFGLPTFPSGNQYNQPDPYGTAFSSGNVHGSALPPLPIHIQEALPIHNQENSRRHFFKPTPTMLGVRPQQGKNVFQIPVMENSKPSISRSASALKIQKVFRGFMVRKGLKRIMDLKKQVNAIAEKLSRPELVELIRRDKEERLRMGQSLMSLLLELDSIRGYDLEVRDCREVLFRKSVELQEKTDSVLSGEYFEVPEWEEFIDEILSEEEGADVELFTDASNDCLNPFSDHGNMEEWDDLYWSMFEGAEKERKNKDEDKRDNELMNDNEKLLSMMRQLSDSHEKQMKMLCTLVDRVELLEKAFICNRNTEKTKQKRKE